MRIRVVWEEIWLLWGGIIICWKIIKCKLIQGEFLLEGGEVALEGLVLVDDFV